MSSYLYRQLECFTDTRVLRLAPANQYSDSLIGSLIHISLASDTIVYEALSYVWNNSSSSWTSTYNWSLPEIRYAFYPPMENEEAPESGGGNREVGFGNPNTDSGGQILCDGQEVHIGAELRDALRRIRLPDKERLLWIDALCINQQDVNERNSQVQNMREIYSQADHVLIWVGEHFSGGSACQALLDFITELELLITMIMETHGSKNRKGIESALIEAYDVHLLRWTFLRELLSRAWFGRVWVLQEVANAKRATLHAGSAKCNWDTIAAITRWLSMYDVNGPLNIRGTICSLRSVDMIWRISRLKEDPRRALPRLIEVLVESRLCMSTHAVDKVYGVLGLVCTQDANSIPIDYAIEASDLYQRVAEKELSRTGLEVLYYCTKSEDSSTVGCPSWTPDWTQPCHHTPYFKLGYKASAAGSSREQFRVAGPLLTAKGRIVDRIQIVELLRAIPNGPYFKSKTMNDSQIAVPATLEAISVDENTEDLQSESKDTDMNNDVFDNRSWFPNVMDIAFPQKIVTAESYEALWRTCCCNRTSDGEIPGVDFAASFGDWTKAMMGLKLRDFENFQRKARRFAESFSLYCSNRRFFRCDSGRLGWGPDKMREGDVVGILHGASIPFILRPVGNRFEVIGDAYVHGIMGGEAMDRETVEREIALI
ncbi:hypothetical protein VTL71DRAFT_9990 [Oculimacula yallundae]|uniref:Heterokaryon incompatibility domain-containing protein n=1 Tax=Oculimacula yallundae TaxID=86028 RepID=A0ABR4BQ51_9HELO